MKYALGYNQCPDDAQGTHSLDEILGAAVGAAFPPATLDLTSLSVRVRNQNPAGTCVGFGVTHAMWQCAVQNDPAFPPLSALSTYRQARAKAGMLKDPQDGCTIADALDAISAGGFQTDLECPYDPSLRNKGLKLGQGQTALRRCGLRSHRIDCKRPDFEVAVKQALSSGKGVVGGWQVGSDFEDWGLEQGPYDGPAGAVDGGHCMGLLDYPDGYPRVVNSWGEDVGDHGLWIFTWQALRKAGSLWVIDFVPSTGA